jgi:hypothetical protein
MINTPALNTVFLGDLIAAACDAAELVSPDPRVSARLATRIVERRLARAHRSDLARRLRALPPLVAAHRRANGHTRAA